jgi:hypothetical protein
MKGDLLTIRDQLQPSRHYQVTTTTEEFKGVLIGVWTNLAGTHFALFRRWSDSRARQVPLSNITQLQQIDRLGEPVGLRFLPWAS